MSTIFSPSEYTKAINTILEFLIKHEHMPLDLIVKELRITYFPSEISSAIKLYIERKV